jgi:YVTN family beta-propeller protein
MQKAVEARLGPVAGKPQRLAFAFRGMLGPLASVATETPNEVALVNVDPADLRIHEHIAVGAAPNGVTADRMGTRHYVSNEMDDSISVNDTGTGRVVGTIPVGIKPVGVVASF